MRRTTQRTRVAELEEALSTANTRIAKLTRELKAAHKRVGELEDERSGRTLPVDERGSAPGGTPSGDAGLERELTGAREQLAQQGEDLSAVRKDLEHHQAELAASEARYERTLAALHQAREIVGLLQDQVIQLEQRIQAFDPVLAGVDDRAAQLQERAEEALAELAPLRTALREVASERDQLERQLAAVRDQRPDDEESLSSHGS